MRSLLGLLLLSLLSAAATATAREGTGKGSSAGQPKNGSFTATLNGFRIHYEVHGQGPVLMTVPNSWGLSTEGLRAFYRPLEERVTMVYFDPRGMGESEPIREDADMGLAAVRADFDALRRHLGLERVNAIGWSNGAGNLILLAAERPDTLEAAIFLHGLASYTAEDMQEFASQYPDLVRHFQEFQEKVATQDLPVVEKTARMKEMWLNHFLAAATADRDAAPAMLNKAFGEAAFSYPHAAYSQQEVPVFDARDKLAQIRARCLVIGGTRDTLPLRKVQELHQGLGQSKIATFEKSGHFAPLEEPAAFKSLVFEFLGVGDHH